MSEIEEALVRIKNLEGVEGYVVCNNEGMVLRHQADMDKKVAEELAKNLTKLASRATNVARDLDPNDDLRILRIKTTRKEVIVSHEKEFIVIVLQQWKQAEEKDV